MKIKSKVLEWAARYLPAEILSTAVTVLSAWLIQGHGYSPVVAALVNSWSGNLTYFGYILVADVNRSYRQQSNYTPASFALNLRSLIIEFGLAEALDSLLIRPLAMYYIPPLISDFSTGIIMAKLSADVLFYIPAIIGYEMNKKVLKNTLD